MPPEGKTAAQSTRGVPVRVCSPGGYDGSGGGPGGRGLEGLHPALPAACVEGVRGSVAGGSPGKAAWGALEAGGDRLQKCEQVSRSAGGWPPPVPPDVKAGLRWQAVQGPFTCFMNNSLDFFFFFWIEIHMKRMQ